MMKLRSDEWLKLTPIVDEGKDVVDIRVWKRTPTGGVPTKKSLIIDEKLVVPLIMTLQKLHRYRSKEKTQTTEAARG
jgi:hypothetical protein